RPFAITSVCDVVLFPGWIVVWIVTTVARVRGPGAAFFAGGGGVGLHAMTAISSAASSTLRRAQRGISGGTNGIATAPLIPRCARDKLKKSQSLFCVVPTSSPMRVDRERHCKRIDVLHRFFHDSRHLLRLLLGVFDDDLVVHRQ